MSEDQQTLPPHRLREIAVAAGVHPNTVARVLEGKPTRALNRERVETALRTLGIAAPAAASAPTRRAKGDRT